MQLLYLPVCRRRIGRRLAARRSSLRRASPLIALPPRSMPSAGQTPALLDSKIWVSFHAL
jgi:hypothetical protein